MTNRYRIFLVVTEAYDELERVRAQCDDLHRDMAAMPLGSEEWLDKWMELNELQLSASSRETQFVQELDAYLSKVDEEAAHLN
jgi:hypothetical protein